MRWKVRWVATGVLAVLLLPLPALGGKPPKPGNANPELTFIEGNEIRIADRDGGNKVAVYANKKAYLRSPLMSPDHRSVVFWEAPLRGSAHIRRAAFSVVDGNVVVGSTETLFESVPGPDHGFALHPLQGDGTRLAIFVDRKLYEMSKTEDCPDRPCTLADLGAPLYEATGYPFEPLSGYTPNGRALYFQEGESLETGLPVSLVRIELGTSPADPVVAHEVLSGLPATSISFAASPIDYEAAPYGYGPFETRLLFDIGTSDYWVREIWTFDTWSGLWSPVLTSDGVALVGHRARWSPDERALIYVRRWQNATNWVRGRVLTFDLDSLVETQVDDFSADPDWAWTTVLP